MRQAAVAAACVFALTRLVSAQADGYTLVARARAYVETFQRNFGSVVAEERYEQRLIATGVFIRRTGPASTVLRSDFLLVQVKGEEWLPFRDVFERDGEPVRDREERLANIFLEGGRDALEQARAIMNEGARYNIGNVDRNVNTPTLALAFLTPRHWHRFEFKPGKRKASDPGIPIEFREQARPTFIVTKGGGDLPVRGYFWIDEPTGTVLRTEIRAGDASVDAHITVTYHLDDSLGFYVPARMEERYRRGRDPVEVSGVATYSKFRRFQVKTSEELAR